MQHARYFLLVILFGTLFSLEDPLVIKEKFTFDVIIKNISAGKSTITISETQINNKAAYKIVSETRTNRIFDFMYKIRDQIIMHVDKTDMSLLNIVKTIRQGRHRQNYSSIVDYESGKIFYKDSEIAISNKVHDPLGIIFYLRKKNFDQEQTFSMSSYNKKKITNLIIHMIGEEEIETKLGKFNCFILEPQVSSDIKDIETMKIWITNNNDRLPLKIEKMGKHGMTTLSLSSYEN